MPSSPQGRTVTSGQFLSDCVAASRPTPTTYCPFDRVPPELLSYILTLIWLQYDGNDSMDRFRFPSIPCNVNRHFNRVTISTPILWSYLRVTYATKLEHIQERIRRRSGALSLDLCVIFEYVDYEEARDLVERIIVANSSRFRTILLAYSYESIIHIPSGKEFWDHLKLLEHHPIRTTRFFIEAGDVDPITFLPLFDPSIRLLQVSCSQFTWPAISPPSSLEILSIRECDSDRVSGLSTATIVQFLSGSISQSLRSLSLSCIIMVNTDDIQGHSCTLDLLDYLKLEDLYMWETIMLFRCILTPRLRHLSLNFIMDDILLDGLKPFWDALRFPYLQKLTLENFHKSRPRQLEFIPNLPNSVKCLEVTGAGSVEALLEPSTSGFCAQLHHIVSHRVPLCDLVSLVQDRRTSLQGLEARYKTVSQVHENLKTRDEFERSLNTIKARVTDLKILVEGKNPEVDQATCLSFEQLSAFYNEDSTLGHPA